MTDDKDLIEADQNYLIGALLVCLRSQLSTLTAEKRKAIFEEIQFGWCKECGGHEPCHCWKDE